LIPGGGVLGSANVSLQDEIFPSERHPDYVQTEWSRGWGYGSIGFADAARFLTEHRARFHASIDQVGLVVFYLQRHRVELALKELLVAHKVDLSTIKSPHSLRALWNVCGGAISAVDKQSWDYLDAAGTEVVSVLDSVDPDSAAFRYPENRKGEEHVRPKFIDLGALEKHVDTFSAAISGYTAYSDEMQQFEAEEYRELQQELQQEYGDDYGQGQ
jgi:hypothetical protein